MEEKFKQKDAPGILRIAIIGPECTGKTTLAKDLSAHFNTEWVPEFARDYLQEKFNRSGAICEPSDMLAILEGQTAAENSAVSRAKRFVFADTSALQSKVYSELYYKFTDPILDKAARKHRYDLFLLTDVHVPWEKDDLRDRPNDRLSFHNAFESALYAHNKPFIALSGSREVRKQNAVRIVQELEQCLALGLTSADFTELYHRGISADEIRRQLAFFENGIPKALLDRAATPGDGIHVYTEEDFSNFAGNFSQAASGLTIEKFVPASGAASRMFKFLSEFINNFDVRNESINAYINRTNASELRIFLAGLEKFPFYPKLWSTLRERHPDFDQWDRGSKVYHFIQLMLDERTFNFGNRPKGVLPFHTYNGHVATPVEEHLREAAVYANSEQTARLHLTISEDHEAMFDEAIGRVRDAVETQTNTTLTVTYSYQGKATDTIAVDLDNKPFRTEAGTLLFRPGGHGALLRNLGARDADIVFIKNIDNVLQNHKEEIARYKKALGYLLLSLRKQVFKYLQLLEQQDLPEDELSEISEFVRRELQLEIPEDFYKYTRTHKAEFLRAALDRPIRVCGMVKNEGEPGGGPFWVRDKRGIPRLQIVESSQVDLNNPAQIAIFQKSTHFNPVDIVCSIKNYRGEKFNLDSFTDPDSGFIVEKTQQGKPLKAYELPGLWNGAMAGWISVFVEVPLITFNPVKTVNDLLKSPHQENG